MYMYIDLPSNDQLQCLHDQLVTTMFTSPASSLIQPADLCHCSQHVCLHSTGFTLTKECTTYIHSGLIANVQVNIPFFTLHCQSLHDNGLIFLGNMVFNQSALRRTPQNMWQKLFTCFALHFPTNFHH